MANHKCAARCCNNLIPRTHVMCKYHWSLVTNDTRKRVLSLFKTSFGSQAYYEAIHDAIEEIADYELQRANRWRPLNAV